MTCWRGQVDLSSQSAVQCRALDQGRQAQGLRHHRPRSRFAGLPDLPTMGEVGYKKLDLDFWHMLLAPAGTQRPIIDRLNAALRHACADAKVRKTFEEGGMDLFPPDQQTPEAASRAAQERAQALGRRDPRQQHLGPVDTSPADDDRPRLRRLKPPASPRQRCSGHLLVRSRLGQPGAAYFSPSLTLGTVSLTSVIGRPWVGAMVLTPSRSIRWSSRSQ